MPAVGPCDVDVALLNGHRFKQIKRLALGHAFHNINQHHVGQFLGRDPVCRSGTHISRADNTYFLPHVFSLS